MSEDSQSPQVAGAQLDWNKWQSEGAADEAPQKFPEHTADLSEQPTAVVPS